MTGALTKILIYCVKKVIDGFYYVGFVGVGQAVVQGEADEALALCGGVDVLTVETSEFFTCGGAVEWDIVENGHYIMLCEVVDETGSGFEVF